MEFHIWFIIGLLALLILESAYIVYLKWGW